jgi:hypothetical protein
MKAAVASALLALLLAARLGAAVDLQLMGPGAAPLSPLGQGSFATDHRQGWGGWGRLQLRQGDWEWGLEGLDASFLRQDEAGRVNWWQAGLSGAWAWTLDPLAHDRVLIRGGLGVAGVDATAPQIDRHWVSAAWSLGLDYVLPLSARFDLLFGGGLWGVLGPDGYDPLMMGTAGLGLAFDLSGPPTQPRARGRR